MKKVDLGLFFSTFSLAQDLGLRLAARGAGRAALPEAHGRPQEDATWSALEVVCFGGKAGNKGTIGGFAWFGWWFGGGLVFGGWVGVVWFGWRGKQALGGLS